MCKDFIALKKAPHVVVWSVLLQNQLAYDCLFVSEHGLLAFFSTSLPVGSKAGATDGCDSVMPLLTVNFGLEV